MDQSESEGAAVSQAPDLSGQQGQARLQQSASAGSAGGILAGGPRPPQSREDLHAADAAAPPDPLIVNPPAVLRDPSLLEPDEVPAKWAVILAKGYGASQKYKVTEPGEAFPDAWCKQKVRDGYYITTVGGRGNRHKNSQQWAVVCTRGVMPGGAQSWRWTGWGDGFPNDWAQKKYDTGMRLTSIGCTAGRWCVVMSTAPKGVRVKQWWAWRDSWPNLFEWIKPKLAKGACITELACTARHCFACVTHTDATEKMKYFWKYDSTFPSKDLVAKCDSGYAVECIAGGMGKWAIVAHSGSWGSVHQRWLYNADSFDKFVEKHRDEGFRIVCVDGMK